MEQTRPAARTNRYDFAGRVALVTGGAGGIGTAAVERLLAGGEQVGTRDRGVSRKRWRA